MKTFLETLNERIVVFDGAMGTNLHAQDLTVEDYGGPQFEGCPEHLLISKPEAVANVHAGFFEVGCDVVETDSFGGASIVLAEYQIAHLAYDLNKKAAELAKRIASDFSTKEKPRWVAGSMGPTTKLPTLGHISFLDMKASYREQAKGLLDGGADLLIDPNDPAESFSFVDELHQLAIRYVTVILSIIHENPSGGEIGKTRGHFGSQLERKAETNLRLQKDKDDGVTTIFAEKARHAHIPKALGPRFVWSEDEHMHVTAGPKPPAHRPKSFDPAEIIELMNGRELGFTETFALCKERGWSEPTFKRAWKQLKTENGIKASLLNRGKWNANGQ